MHVTRSHPFPAVIRCPDCGREFKPDGKIVAQAEGGEIRVSLVYKARRRRRGAIGCGHCD